MTFADKDSQTLYDNLLRRGVSKEDIEKVYKGLRDKGYGEEEARRRSRLALARMKAQKDLGDRRRGASRAAPSPRIPGEALPPREAKAAAGARETDAAARRAVDWLPIVTPRLRRRINRWAFRNGYLITRLPEVVQDFLAMFDRSRDDYVNRALIQLLAGRRGSREANPYEFSFIDSLDALRDSARRLLGGPPVPAAPRTAAPTAAFSEKLKRREAEVKRSLRAREPFALDFFGAFTGSHDMLRRSLEYAGISLKAGTRLAVADLARIVRDGCRLVVATDSIEREKLDSLFDAVREANLGCDRDSGAPKELLEAERLFRAAFQNLRRYGHELYPALLKMIACFYEESDASPEKTGRILEFLGLRAEEILTWEGWQRRARAEQEKALREQQERELARLEQEKAEMFSLRFEGTLAMLSALFPESGMERAEQGEYILPHFVNRVFARSPIFPARIADLERVSASDVMGIVMVLHSVLDDLLSSLDPYVLEKLVGGERIAAGIVEVRDGWREASSRLFDPYLAEIREFSREVDGDPRYAKLFRESQRARTAEERINQLRNHAIRNFGHVISDRERYDGPKLYDLAARLSALLAEAGDLVNQATLSAHDPVRMRVAEDLDSALIVDLSARSLVGSADFRPVTRQVRRYIEARRRKPVEDIPREAQVEYFEILRGLADMYAYILNDPKSFAAQAGHAVAVAAEEERAAWAREKSTRGRGSFDSVQAAVREEFPGQFTDALTGLKNKEYFLGELPKMVEKLKARQKPLTLLMIDIDHFKKVNDELGHPKGDEVLKLTAGMILDSIREGDVAVRYGGEEMLVVVPADLHTGIILAERFRHVQELAILERESLRDVRGIGVAAGQACGTLSIGVADASEASDLGAAVERADKALYAAKRTRNAVVFIDPSRERNGGEPYSTYAEYRRRAKDSSG